MNLLLSIVNSIAVLTILILALNGANRMTKSTRFQIRMGYILAAVGAFSVLVAPLFGMTQPAWPQVAVHSGVAMMMWCSRRSA
jgi:hypothetical protein